MKYQKILNTLDKEIEYLVSAITSGSCSSYDDYRYNAGRLASLRNCVLLIKKSYNDDE